MNTPNSSLYRHVILTPFSIPVPRYAHIRAQPGWLEHRFELFEQYTLASMATQDTDNFVWIVYFDEATPEPFRERIEACRKLYDFIPFYTHCFDAPGWRESVIKVLKDPAEWLLTTRLDSDDAFASDHMRNLQNYVDTMAAPERCSLNMINGYVLSDGRLYAHRHRSNAFASWLEPWSSDMITAQCIQHMKMAEFGPVYQVESPPAWLQVVHGSNLSNVVRGRRIKPDEASLRFPDSVCAHFNPASDLEVAMENGLVVPVRKMRDKLISVIRRRPMMYDY